MKYRCILLDVDGTLISTWNLYMEVYWQTLRYFKGNHITKDTILSLRPTSELQFIKNNIGSEYLREAHSVMMNYYDEYHDALFGGYYDGIPEMLENLRRMDYKLGIVTGKSSRAWEITLSKIDAGNFDVVIADDDVEHPKPHPDGIERALRQTGTTPDETIYIGDTLSDFNAARSANVRGVLALWAKSESDREKFLQRARETGAEDFIQTPRDIFKILG